jgi:ubiquinone/menaquinone biosynthesis C-methylase UbiE
MASGFIDVLTSPTLKYLRERWWNDDFAEFLTETLRPRAGNRILDVGCGEGIAEIQLGRLNVSQMRLVGVDLMLERVIVARHETAAHNQRVGFACADACHLPFHDKVFDSTFCVAVLQHIGNVAEAVRDFARVTRIGGRILVVEPDNGARYWYSSTPAGRRVFEMSSTFFSSMAAARREAMEAAVGPKLPTLFAACGIEPLEVRLFPVSQTRLGPPPPAVWARRHDVVQQLIDQAPNEEVRVLGRAYLNALDAYAAEAQQAGPAFVEIQHTMLFATVGQRFE